MRRNDDEAIIALMRENPEAGFRLFMAEYKEPLYWHIRRLVVSHDDAQDAAQEAFVRIFRSFSKFRGDSTFSSWVYKIATNEALRLISRNKGKPISLDWNDMNIVDFVADDYVDFSDLETVKLQKAILSLPTKQQLAFNLRYYDELGYEEIADIIGSTASSAKVNYHVAKEKIIKYMNSND